MQEAPLTAIAENLQYEEKLRKEENHKIRYLGFGIRFQKTLFTRKTEDQLYMTKQIGRKSICPRMNGGEL